MSKKKFKSHDGPSKKERKALLEREATIAAELAEREAKAAKKAAKKAKKAEVVGVDFGEMLSRMNAAEEVLASANKVLSTKGSSKGAIAAATAAKVRAEAELAGVPAPAPTDDDAAIKARVEAKRTRRDLIAAAPAALEALDRGDKAAVDAYNETYGAATGSYATSTEELEGQVAKVKGVTLDQAYEEMVESTGKTEEELYADPEVEKLLEQSDQVVEEVETDKGRVFEAGTAAAEPVAEAAPAFAKPSDAPPEIEVGRNGYKIKTPAGKEAQYTRVTTFIKLIEDKTNLERWSKRKLLEGVIVDQTPNSFGTVFDRLGKIRDLIHNRDVAIAKARKADRKGKLAVGELAELVAAAEKLCKDGMNALIVELEELGGGKDAANKGTELHSLTELHDREGIEAVADLLTEGKITPADFADIEAYSRAIKAANIEFTHIEKFVVDDERRVAGRLDRAGLAKFPGMMKRIPVVMDIKTGSIDYGISLPMQLENYATMMGYDPANPDAREDLKLNRLRALVIHLPQGTGQCHIYPVDLQAGRLGNRITKEGRDFRNSAKKAIDKTVDLGDAEAVAAYNAKLEAEAQGD